MHLIGSARGSQRQETRTEPGAAAPVSKCSSTRCCEWTIVLSKACFGPHKRFNCHTLFSSRRAMRVYLVFAENRWNDKCFRVVDDQRLKEPSRTFDDGLLSLRQIQHVHGAASTMRHGPAKPMPARLDELAFMQTRLLFPPSLAFADRPEPVDEILACPFGSAVPLNVCKAVFDVNRTGRPVETHAAPVPQLERKNVRRRADFENQAVAAGTVDGSRRD